MSTNNADTTESHDEWTPETPEQAAEQANIVADDDLQMFRRCAPDEVTVCNDRYNTVAHAANQLWFSGFGAATRDAADPVSNPSYARLIAEAANTAFGDDLNGKFFVHSRTGDLHYENGYWTGRGGSPIDPEDRNSWHEFGKYAGDCYGSFEEALYQVYIQAKSIDYGEMHYEVLLEEMDDC